MKAIAILIHLLPTIFIAYPFMQVTPAEVQSTTDAVIDKPLITTTESTPTIDTTTGYRAIYIAAAEQYGIPWQILEAIHQVETGKDGDTCRQSYAGATGPMQFMPATWRAYGKGDICSVHDSIYGAAHLLATGGAAEGRVYEAIFNYNHADWYVQKVLSIARDLGYSD